MEKATEIIKIGRIIVISIALLSFVSTTILVIVSSHKKGNEGIPFRSNFDVASMALSYAVLFMFLLMAAVNIALFC